MCKKSQMEERLNQSVTDVSLEPQILWMIELTQRSKSQSKHGARITDRCIHNGVTNLRTKLHLESDITVSRESSTNWRSVHSTLSYTTAIIQFNPEICSTILLAWTIDNNISFSGVEHSLFCILLRYLMAFICFCRWLLDSTNQKYRSQIIQHYKGCC